jgi:general stress protein 26
MLDSTTGDARAELVPANRNGNGRDDQDRSVAWFDFLATFQDAVLTSSSDSGQLWSRPAALIGSRGGEVLFGTRLTEEQRRGLDARHQVSLAFQDRRRFLGVRGSARLLEDRACLDGAWPFLWKVTTGSAQDGEELALLSVRPESAELWDPGARSRTRVAFG